MKNVLKRYRLAHEDTHLVIRTYTGRQVYKLDPLDIAHANEILNNLNALQRFGRGQQKMKSTPQRRFADDGRPMKLTSAANPVSAKSKRLTKELTQEIVERALSGETAWQIAGSIWERAGYTSRNSCDAHIRKILERAKV